MNKQTQIGAPGHSPAPRLTGEAGAPVNLPKLIECWECDGAGYWLETVRCAGEAYDADQIRVDCDECDGTGMVEDEAL